MLLKYLGVIGISVLFFLGFIKQDLISPSERFHVKIKAKDFKSSLKTLAETNLDIAGVNVDSNEIGLVVTLEQLSWLEERYPVISVNELGAGVDSEYKDPKEIEEILRGYAAKYPLLCELRSIGKSIQGRDIWALRLTNLSKSDRLKKPAFYINGMHHAREVMSPEVPLDMIEYLLTRYGSDPKATHWLDQNEIWAIPMVNPDGNNVVWNSNNWWRKNVAGGFGVDVNRNYPYMWGQCGGSSSNKNADNYRGPSAGSENETQALVELIKDIRPVTSLSLHSYSELILYPLSCKGQEAAHRDFFRRVGGQIAGQIRTDGGGGVYKHGTPWEILYSVDGGDIDWLYKEFNVMPFVVEMNQEFQVDYGQYRDKTVQKLRVAWMTLLDLLDGSGIRGRVPGVQGETLIQVRNLNAKARWSEYSYRTSKDGSFHIILDPGTYEILGRRVEVGAKRVDLE